MNRLVGYPEPRWMKKNKEVWAAVHPDMDYNRYQEITRCQLYTVEIEDAPVQLSLFD